MPELVKILENEEYVLYSPKVEGIPESSFIFSSKPSRALLSQQWLAGKDVQRLAEDASTVFLHIAKEHGPLKGLAPAQICEVVLLCGGIYYGIGKAFLRVFGKAAQQCFIGIKRYQEPDGSWKANASYSNFEALKDNATLVIGDTIASGATMAKAISTIKEEVLRRNMRLNSIIVFSLAGGVDGVRRLRAVEEELRAIWPGFRMYYYGAEGIFHVEPNGTDMPFNNPNTVLTPEMSAELAKKPLVFEKMKCCIFDWGNRCKNPIGHWHEFIEFCDELLSKETDPTKRAEIKRWRKKAERDIAKYQVA